MSRNTPLVVSIVGWIVLAFVVLLLILMAIAFAVGLLLPALAHYRGAS